jgi:Bacterial archaeo-eukaryotic release factor family 10
VKPTRELLVELSTWREPAGGVLSVYARTDPRDPANTARTPAWLVALRNGLAAVGRRIDEAGTRAERLAFRALSERVEAELPALEPAARARGVAWFLSADGALDRRVSLQLAPRAGAVRWDERPVVSPLVDVVDRGRATGLVLVAGERVRLLHWEGGRVSEPERSVFELELGDWREYAAYARANPARAQQTATHQAAFEQRVEDWRRRFLRDAAAATSDRLAELGWRRLLIAAEGQFAAGFAAALPAAVRAHVVAEVAANLLWEDPPRVANRLEEHLERAWRDEVIDGARRALEAARSGTLGVAGFAQVLNALADSRVEWLFIDPLYRFDAAGLAPAAAQVVVGATRELLAERAVERAVAGGAGVSALPECWDTQLAEAGGVAARLRF